MNLIPGIRSYSHIGDGTRNDVILQSLVEIDEIVAVSAYADDEVAVTLRMDLGVEQIFRINDVDRVLLTAAAEKRFGERFERLFAFRRIEHLLVELRLENEAGARVDVVVVEYGFDMRRRSAEVASGNGCDTVRYQRVAFLLSVGQGGYLYAVTRCA